MRDGGSGAGAGAPLTVPRLAANPQPLAGNIAPVELRDLPHAELLRLRNALPPNDPRHAQLAPLEHAAFAREWTRDNPFLAVPALAVSIPGYSIAKAVGLSSARTPGNISEVLEGFRGVGRGLRDYVRGNKL